MRTLACFLAIGLIIVGAIAQESAPSVQNILEEWRAGNREAAVQLAEQLKASAKYGDLSVEDKLLLHSFLRRAYLYAGEPAKVEEQRLEIARLSAAASRKSVNEIVELCAQGRFAEAMYYIEIYDAQMASTQSAQTTPQQQQADEPRQGRSDFPSGGTPSQRDGATSQSSIPPRIIISPEEVDTVKQQARKLSAEQIREQIVLRRCLAQIYAADESEEAMRLATLQFQMILSLDRRYSLKDDPTLREQTTPKIHQAFRNALPKQNLALPILGSLVGGVLIATQNQGTTTGLGATFEVNNRSIESGEDYTVVQIQIVYRDSLGRIARSDSETTGILTIKDIGGNYRIELNAARGQFDVPLGPVKEIGSTEVSVRYTVDRGEAYINLKIFYPEQPPQDELPPELDLPDVSVEFAVTVTSSIGTPQTPRTVNHTISLTHTPRSRAPRNALLTLTASQRAAQANGLYILQSAGASHRLSARPDAPLWAALLRGRDYYRVLSLTEISQGDRVVVYSEHAQPVTLQWTTAEPSRGVELALRDLTSGSVLSLSRSNTYTYHPNPQETRVFEIVRTPRVRTPLIISQVSVQVSRSTGVSNITMTVNQPASVQVSLEDARGQVLYQAVRNASRGANTFVVAAERLRQLPPGAYLMKVEAQTENGDHARRAVPVVLTR